MGVTVCRYTDRNFKAVYKVGLCDEFYSVFNYDNKNWLLQKFNKI